MSDLSYTVTIDKVAYTDEQLARYEYERTLHVLHELKRLGADVRDGGRALSHTDINWLEPERAAQISLDIRESLGEAASRSCSPTCLPTPIDAGSSTTRAT